MAWSTENGQSRRGLAKVAHVQRDLRKTRRSGKHSGQVSQSRSRTSLTAATATSGETVKGGSWHATTSARSQECGLALSCIEPCSSHSRMEPASSTEIAQLRSLRTAGRRPSSASRSLLPDESFTPSPFRAANKRRGSRIAESAAFPLVPSSDCTMAPGRWRFSLLPLSAA